MTNVHLEPKSGGQDKKNPVIRAQRVAPTFKFVPEPLYKPTCVALSGKIDTFPAVIKAIFYLLGKNFPSML